jgi:hypothetical protein
MVKLIIQQQKNPPGTATTKSTVCLVKVLEFFLMHPILVLVLGILGFLEKGAAPLVGQIGWRELGSWVFFSCFSHSSWSYGLSITSGSSGMVSPVNWLVSSIWFLLSTGCNWDLR